MLAGFVHLVASQVITRILTFGLNLATARSLTPEAYGVAAIQFHLINTTILLISREGFRRACLRINQHAPGATRRVLSIAAITVPFGALLSTAVTAVLLSTVGGEDAVYRLALLMQGAAAFVEILSEPLYILAATRLLFGLRVGVETAAMCAKGLLTLALVRRPGMPPAIAFSWAQLAFAAVTLAGYSTYFLPELARGGWLPRTQPQQQQAQGTPRPATGTVAAPPAEGGADWGTLRLAGTFTLQAVGKLLLAEGSKMAAAALQPAREQGVYGMVQALGSVVVRTLFQPFEEAAFVAFSKAQGQGAPTCTQLRRQARLLAVLVRGITTVGLLAAAFGPAYSYLALLLVYSRKWADTEAPAALGLYSLLLVLLAANGILEACVHALSDERQLHANNAAMVAFTATHAALSVAGVRAGGACGLVLADAASMALRIAYCLAFARRRFAHVVPEYRLRAMLPSRQTMAALAAAAALTCTARIMLLSESSLLVRLAARRGVHIVPPALARMLSYQPFAVLAAAHIAVGAACLAIFVAAIARHERVVVSEVQQLRKQHQS